MTAHKGEEMTGEQAKPQKQFNRSAYLIAARSMDWQQVALNHPYGAPCFHLEPYGKFCGRAASWHNDFTEKEFHPYTPLDKLLELYRSL